MRALLRKEMRLSALALTYFFIAFAFMTLIPGYPILCGAFFMTLGLFQSFQNAREANDIVYSALLPVAKKDVVKGKYLFTLFIEMAGFTVMAILTLVRMTALADAPVYRQNALMNANLFFLGMVLVLFGLFNALFVGRFFKTAYKLGKNYVIYIILAFLVIAMAEAVHFIPGFEDVNAFGFAHAGLQIALLLAGVICFAALTFVSFKKACRAFENVDL